MNTFNMGDIVRINFVYPVDVAQGLAVGTEGEVVHRVRVAGGPLVPDDVYDVHFEGQENSFPMEASQLLLVSDAEEPTKTPYVCPQSRTVMDHLRKVGEISGKEADFLYRVVDLPKRISELRAAGHTIFSQWRKDTTGKKYKRYFWEPEAASA